MLQGRQEMRPLFLRGMPHLEHGVRASRPLVFLNACEVGRLEPGLVGAGGFAEAFMNLGAGGVVAALWSVKDDLAHQLAEEFYRRVEAEPTTPYAAILRDLRARSYADDRRRRRHLGRLLLLRRPAGGGPGRRLNAPALRTSRTSVSAQQTSPTT